MPEDKKKIHWDKIGDELGLFINGLGAPLGKIEGFANALMHLEEVGTLNGKQKEFVTEILEAIETANYYRQKILALLYEQNE